MILRSNESDNVRVGNVDLSELQVFGDGERQLSKCQIACGSFGDRVCTADVPVVERHTGELLATSFHPMFCSLEDIPNSKRLQRIQTMRM